MTKSHKLAITGITLIIVGLLALTPFAIAWAQAQQTVAPATVNTPVVNLDQSAQPVEKAAITGKPIRLEVLAAGITINVIDGNYDKNTGEWTLTDHNAQFAVPTTQPNDKSGNTLIYGHDTPAVFNRLHKLIPGAEAKVYTDNGHVFTYKMRAKEVVNPSNIGILNYQGKPQLTLQTCTGLLSENRELFYFDFVNAQ